MSVALIPVAKPTRPVLVPLVSSLIAAGYPSPASDHIEGFVDLNRLLVRNPEGTVLVRVMGESMAGAEIHAGDLLTVDKHLEADHNCIVVAVVDGEYTVKRLVREQDSWWLKPENPEFDPYCISSPDTVRIWGVVTGFYRELQPGVVRALLQVNG